MDELLSIPREDFISHLESEGVKVAKQEKPFQGFYLLELNGIARTIKFRPVIPGLQVQSICIEFGIKIPEKCISATN